MPEARADQPEADQGRPSSEKGAKAPRGSGPAAAVEKEKSDEATPTGVTGKVDKTQLIDVLVARTATSPGDKSPRPQQLARIGEESLDRSLRFLRGKPEKSITLTAAPGATKNNIPPRGSVTLVANRREKG